MYEDFYPYIPGSLDAKLRIRKLRLKRLFYCFGAIMVFSSGFLLGLVWYELDSAYTQTALQNHRPIEVVDPLPVKTFTPPAEPIVHSLPPPLPPPSKSDSHTHLDAKTATDTDETLTETGAPPPSVILSASTAASRPRPPDQKPVAIRVKKISQPKTAKPQKQKQTQPPRSYLVQIGAFRNEANARSMVAKLRDKGYQPFTRVVQNRQNHVLYRVFLDRAEDRAQAQATAKAFEETEKMDTLVMLADSLSRSRPLPDRREAGSR